MESSTGVKVYDVCFDITLQGYKHQKAYIITEGPMLSTVRNMLKILYDRKVGAVVMLSGFMKNGQVITYIAKGPSRKKVCNSHSNCTDIEIFQRY